MNPYSNWLVIENDGIFLHKTHPVYQKIPVYLRQKNDEEIDLLHKAADLTEKHDIDIFNKDGECIDINAEIWDYDYS